MLSAPQIYVHMCVCVFVCVSKYCIRYIKKDVTNSNKYPIDTTATTDLQILKEVVGWILHIFRPLLPDIYFGGP